MKLEQCRRDGHLLSFSVVVGSHWVAWWGNFYAVGAEVIWYRYEPIWFRTLFSVMNQEVFFKRRFGGLMTPPMLAGLPASPPPVLAGLPASPPPVLAGPPASPSPVLAGLPASPPPVLAGPPASPPPVLAGPPASPSPVSVPKLVDLGGKWHPLVNNFPLSLLIFNVNFSLSADDLAFVTVITPPPKPVNWNHHSFLYKSNSCHISSKFSTLSVFLGPKFFTPIPSQDCNFGTLPPVLAGLPASPPSVLAGGRDCLCRLHRCWRDRLCHLRRCRRDHLRRFTKHRVGSYAFRACDRTDGYSLTLFSKIKNCKNLLMVMIF